MSEETETMLDFEYEDQFSYLTEDGDLMLKETSLFAERKIAEVTDKDSLSEIVNEYQEAFGRLKDRVETLLEQDEKGTEDVDELIEELKNAQAIGDFEDLYEQLKNVKESLSQPVPEQEETTEEKQETKSTDGAEEQQAEETSDEEKSEEEQTGIGYYEEIVEKAESLSKQSDWPYVTMELDNLANKWNEGPEVEGDEVKELLGRFQDAQEKFEQRKEEHYEQLNKQKKENLEKKKELLEKLTDIVENKQWTATQKVSSLKGQWNSVGILPSGTGDELEEKFNAQLKEFDEHKVDRLVSKRQQEEDNLTGKLIVLDKMEDLASSIDDDTNDWKAVDNEFDDLTKQYKRIGRVPAEKSDEVWDRYKSAQDKYYDQKYKYDKKHRQKFDKYYQKKEDLCRKAEALLEEDNLPKAAKELNKLHRRWKKTGNLPQRDEDKLWARFKAATDSFNEYKSEHLDELKEQEEANYNKKMELIEKAREINDTSDWDKGHSKMQSLLDQWKKVGPVPRNKSRKLWKQFKEAQDVFYERRREHFKDRKEQQKENLKEKEEILEKLRELGQLDDPIEAVEQAKPLQEKFKEAGYVPIKRKNEIWKRYREACDVIYERFRAAKSGNKFDQELAKADLDPDQRSKIMGIRKKYKKVKHEMHELEEEVLQYKESRTYFKSSDDDNPLLNEIKSKIEKVENRLQKKQDKLDELDEQIDDIRREG
ncbi:DUF349 domain-containing protein [Aliifodinibius sp. S!AR15-10]|uniref:DUF349 domain-containing protein n=1 Tax=Aliifodinibius sp. S!AR15-10 TaxID=2950437 RepID=UPI002865CC98|nr:DUF349 domain-containing protein [Aliifodinibius sp. S!AR15-10]MDR8392677.1 DUF349 domain-containing protein [Aliifodinibius sp. S!AR15-10]